MKNAKFNIQNQSEFVKTLKDRINSYFKEKNISSFGNSQLYWKTAVMLSLYIIPYCLIVINFMPFWANWFMYMIMGVGMVGIGMSVMHDANHGSFSSNKTVNRLFSLSMEFVGGNSINWKVQHNLFHHTYTNIPGLDEDIAEKAILRLEPTAAWLKIHKYQHIYALPLYSLLTINWLLWGDVIQLVKYIKKGMLKQVGAKTSREIFKLVIFKIYYIALHFIIPIFLVGLSWWVVLIGFLIMQLIAGFTLSVVFQLAHVVEPTEYPLPDDQGNIENSWAVHQLFTTANFAKKDKLLSWFIGGLNYQIEHHLFPNISHIHYPKIAEIVKKTAMEFQLPYNEFHTFRSAFYSHMRSLKTLGKKPELSF